MTSRRMSRKEGRWVVLAVCSLIGAALFLSVVPSAPAVLPAPDGGGCEPNVPYEDGYTHAASTPSSAWATVVYNSASVRNSGSIRSFLEVSNPYDESNNLIVGILNTGSGPQLYIEHSGQFVVGSKVSVSKDTGYTVALFHNSSSNTSSSWTADWNNNGVHVSYTTTINYSDPPIVFLMHSQTTDTACNVV